MPVTEVSTDEVVARSTAMASPLMVRVCLDGLSRLEAESAAQVALGVFTEVDRACTRFDPNSPLMRANANPGSWHRVPRMCLDAVAEAYAAYRWTGGRFDPRVLDDLVRLGYDRSTRVGPPSPRGSAALQGREALPAWAPRFRSTDSEVLLGPHPVDLGGIAKGLAVRWAAERLDALGVGHLVDAGGDCWCGGAAPDGGPWRVAVEDPRGGETPVAVLGVSDAAVATSSVRLLQWQVAGVSVHHLIDPTTGRPGGEGLRSVTVVDRDPAVAEVWSKTLFLAGHQDIAAEADRHGCAALWVDVDGTVEWSARLTPYLLWRRDA